MSPSRSRRSPRRVPRGAIHVEYSVLVGSVALTCTFALVGLGAAFARNFDLVRALVLYPIP